jgi:hypothetical protein
MDKGQLGKKMLRNFIGCGHEKEFKITTIKYIQFEINS